MEKDMKASQEDTEHYDLEILLRRPSLRVNIPRKVSQICRDTIMAEETACGIGCIRGKWLQSFAKRTSYVFIYGILGSIYGSYYAYFYGVITTVEKRFQISSQTIGLIASGGYIVHIITCFILFLCMPKAHKPQIAAVGVLIMAASTVIFTLPHFLYKYEFKTSIYNKNYTVIRTCTEGIESCSENLERNGPIICLIIAQSLHGIGGSLYLLVGKDYEEENIEKDQKPAIFSILSVLKSLGPAFGYWLSSLSLKTFELHNLMPNVNITEDEPDWIGAWWLGSLVIGFILIVPGIFLALFPTTLPKTAAKRIHNQQRKGPVTEENVTERMGKMASFEKLFFNPTFNCAHYTGIFNVMGFMAYFIFLPKYVQIQFRLTASIANLISGSAILMSSTIGIVVANSVITRYHPSARVLVSWSIIASILSLFGLVSQLYLGCETNDYQIKRMSTQHLNITCNCSNSPFFPICDDYIQTFISPCHAQCQKEGYVNKTEDFEECSQKLELLKNNKKLFTGFCPVNCQSDLLKFVIITCFIAFTFATGRTPYYWFETRYKQKQAIPVILSSTIIFIGFLASIIAPVLFGYILDESCLLWEGNCHKTKNCWLYDNEKLRFNMNFTAIGFAIVCIIYDFLVWCLVKNIKLFNHINHYINEINNK